MAIIKRNIRVVVSATVEVDDAAPNPGGLIEDFVANEWPNCLRRVGLRSTSLPVSMSTDKIEIIDIENV